MAHLESYSLISNSNKIYRPHQTIPTRRKQPFCMSANPMTPFCMSATLPASVPKALIITQPSTVDTKLFAARCPSSLATMLPSRWMAVRNRRKHQSHVVCMAPDEERLTRRNPLDFPIEWDRPKPGRRADIFPQFSPMKTPLPPPMPYDPPEEDEDDEEKKEEEEENPDQEESDQPERQ